jgi:hypothetical protein
MRFRPCWQTAVGRSSTCRPPPGYLPCRATCRAGLLAVPGFAPYVASKHGVIGLTETAALDYAAHNLRINAIAPGPIYTHHLERAGERAREHVAQSVPGAPSGTAGRGRGDGCVAVLGPGLVRDGRHDPDRRRADSGRCVERQRRSSKGRARKKGNGPCRSRRQLSSGWWPCAPGHVCTCRKWQASRCGSVIKSQSIGTQVLDSHQPAKCENPKCKQALVLSVSNKDEL